MHTTNIFWLVTILVIVIFALVYYSTNTVCEKFDDKLRRIVSELSVLDPKVKNLSFNVGKESYTEDKLRIHICMKDGNGDYYDDNSLKTVVIHELAHALTTVVDDEHVTKEFRDKYNELMTKAQQLGLVDPTKPVPLDYCPKDK